MAHYLDFVGLNTFIYEMNGWEGSEGPGDSELYGPPASAVDIYAGLNHLGNFVSYDYITFISRPISWYKNYRFSHNLPTTASFFPALVI